ncbi:MAG: mandelate racemase/muconate lactonizing enzyme family protein [Acidimicrobiales bacterium]
MLLSHVYPPGEELEWVAGAIRSWDAALVEVTLSDGSTGIGEVGAGIMAASAVPGIVEALRRYAIDQTFAHPLEVGDRLRSYTAFWSRGGISSGVVGAIETAALDAVAQRESAPAFELLGGLKRYRIEAYASGGLGSSFEHVAQWADAQVTSGFRTVKFRAMKDPDTTISLLEHVVPRLPSRVRFVIDAVQASASHPWSVDDAIRVGLVAEKLDALWFEEPCFATDLAGYAKVSDALRITVSGIESNSTLEEFIRLFELKGVGLAQPDVSIVGGPMNFQRVANLARDYNVGCVPHVWGSAVTFSANLHAALAHGHVNLFEYCTLPNPLREELLVEPIQLIDGCIKAPTGPGLGVRVDPDIERKFAFSAGAGHVIR